MRTPAPLLGLLVPPALLFGSFVVLPGCGQSSTECAAPNLECDLGEITSDKACDEDENEDEDEKTCRVISVEQCDETYTKYCRPDPNSSTDPCDGEDLPDCPAECPADDTVECGSACETEDEECGNDIGDGRKCTDGVWECSVHAPLGDDHECNRVCQKPNL